MVKEKWKRYKNQVVCKCSHCGKIIKLKYRQPKDGYIYIDGNFTYRRYKSKEEMQSDIMAWGCKSCDSLFDVVIICNLLNNCDKCKIKYSCLTTR